MSCLNAGARCKLNNQSAFATPEDVVNKIDFAIDKLYENPVPVHALDIPAVATAGNLRGLLFRDMYQVDTWQDLARQLAAAFEGNYTEVVKETITRVHAKSGSQRDASARAVYSVIVGLLFMLIMEDSSILCAVCRLVAGCWQQDS